MSKTPALSLTDKNLRQLLQMNPNGISLPAMESVFGLKESETSSFKEALKALIDEGFATYDPKNQYRAVKPMSDLVVARIKPNQKSAKELELKIDGVEEDFPFTVVIKSANIRTKFGRNLTPAEPIAVVLSRRRASTLVATKILGRYDRGKRPSIVGNFNGSATKDSACFTTKTPGISTSFKVAGSVPEKADRRIPYHAIIPQDLDPYDPRLDITEQKWDPVTGAAISMIIAKKHGVNPNHSPDTLAEAKARARLPIPWEGRRDLSDKKILVIDPTNAGDHDDGILIERTQDGYRTLVVVSDVPYYVRSGTTLDASARKKGFTHYFPDENFHMLPERLVKQASLFEGSSKPVIYVEQDWDLDFNKSGLPTIGAGVISNHRQYTYGQFENLVHDHPEQISAYIELGDALIERMRFEKVTFDTDDRNRQHSYSQMLVAAMMIEANSSIAKFLLERNIPFPSRSHTGNDNLIAFNELRSKLEDWGYDVPDDIAHMSNETLRRIIAASELRGDKHRVESTIRSEFLNRALYSMVPYSHFGLNRENYTHATSPIRRYSDNLVLRGIHTALGNNDLGLSSQDTDDMADVCREMNRLQNTAQRVAQDVSTYYAILDLQRLEGHMVRATLGRVDAFRAEIIMPERSGLRYYMNLGKLPEDWAPGKTHNSLFYKGNPVFSNDPIRIKIGTVKPNEGLWEIIGMEAPRKKALKSSYIHPAPTQLHVQ